MMSNFGLVGLMEREFWCIERNADRALFIVITISQSFFNFSIDVFHQSLLCATPSHDQSFHDSVNTRQFPLVTAPNACCVREECLGCEMKYFFGDRCVTYILHGSFMEFLFIGYPKLVTIPDCSLGFPSRPLNPGKVSSYLAFLQQR